MLKQRVITALVLLAILLPALFYPSTVPFTVVVLVLMAAGAWEWGRLSGFGQAGSLTVGAACVALCAGSWALGWVDRSLTALWVVGGGLWVLAAACFKQAPPIANLLMRAATVSIDPNKHRSITDILIAPEMPGIELRDWKEYDDAVEAGYTSMKQALADVKGPLAQIIRGNAAATAE